MLHCEARAPRSVKRFCCNRSHGLVDLWLCERSLDTAVNEGKWITSHIFAQRRCSALQSTSSIARPGVSNHKAVPARTPLRLHVAISRHESSSLRYVPESPHKLRSWAPASFLGKRTCMFNGFCAVRPSSHVKIPEARRPRPRSKRSPALRRARNAAPPAATVPATSTTSTFE